MDSRNVTLKVYKMQILLQTPFGKPKLFPEHSLMKLRNSPDDQFDWVLCDSCLGPSSRVVSLLSQTVTFYLTVSSWPAKRFQIVYNPSRDFISPRESGGKILKFFEKWEIFLWCMIDVKQFCEVSSEASPFECEGSDCKYFLIPELVIKTISHNN